MHSSTQTRSLWCATPSAIRRPLLLDQVESTLRAHRVDILDVMLVRRGYAYPFGPDRNVVADASALPGRDHPQVQLMTAASALQGRAILPDREALRRSVAGPVGAAKREALDATRRAADQVIGVLGGQPGPMDRPALRRLRDTAVDSALDHAGHLRLRPARHRSADSAAGRRRAYQGSPDRPGGPRGRAPLAGHVARGRPEHARRRRSADLRGAGAGRLLAGATARSRRWRSTDAWQQRPVTSWLV